MTNVNVDRGADPAGGQRLPTPDPNHSSFGGKTETCYKSVFFSPQALEPKLLSSRFTD